MCTSVLPTCSLCQVLVEARRGHQEHKLWAAVRNHMDAGNRTEAFYKKRHIPTIMKDDKVINLRGALEEMKRGESGGH